MHQSTTDAKQVRRNATNLEVGEQSKVRRDLVSGGTKAGQRRERVDVDFAGVGLRGDGVGVAEPAQFSDELVKLFDLNESKVTPLFIAANGRDVPYRGHRQIRRGSWPGCPSCP